MLKYSILEKEDVNRILIPYGIKNLTHAKRLSGGSENTNYLITTKDHHYVLNLFEHKSIVHAKNLSLLLSYLKQYHFKTSLAVSPSELPTSSAYKSSTMLSLQSLSHDGTSSLSLNKAFVLSSLSEQVAILSKTRLVFS